MDIFIEYLNTTKQGWWESQWFITILGALLGAIVPILLTIFINFRQEKRNEQFKKSINNSNNEFQHSMVQMQIDADITARARIEWIQNARNTTVDFINSCYSLVNFMNIIEIGKTKQGIPKDGGVASASISFEKTSSKKLEVFGSDEKNIFVEQANVQRHGTLLALYFGPDDAKENEFIVYLIENIIKKLTSGEALFENQDVLIIEMIDDLKNALRAYYKIEWKRASGSFKDEEVNEKLNSEDIYKYVKDKYEAPFMDKDDPSKKDTKS